MLRVGLISLLFALASCGSRENDNSTNSLAANPTESPAQDAETTADSLLDRVTAGDRTACGDAEAHQEIKNMLFPKLPSPQEQSSANKFYGRKFPIISQDIWKSQWASNTSITDSVPVSFDDFSKEVTCSASFLFTPLGSIRLDFSMQPSADNAELIYKVKGNIVSEESRNIISAKLVALSINQIKSQSNIEEFSEISFNVEQKRLIDSFYSLQDLCQGGGNDAETEGACRQWGEVSKELKALGVCYGRTDQATYQWKMHVCDAGSN